MNNVVAGTSRSNYNRINKTFVLYLFKKRNEDPDIRRCLTEDIILVFEDAQSTSEKKLVEKIKNALDRFVNFETCFFILTNITFPVFSNYVISRRNTNMSYSNSFYQSLRSALMHLFRTASIDPPLELNKELKKFMAGLRRTVAKDIQDQGISCEQGKSAMGFSVYKRLCEILVASPNPEDVFTRAWLTLEWSLMARADQCVQSHINHLQWRDDSLVIFFAKKKQIKMVLTRAHLGTFMRIRTIQQYVQCMLFPFTFLLTPIFLILFQNYFQVIPNTVITPISS